MDNIIKILDDPDLAQRMGNFGRQRVISELQWTHEIPKLLNAYDQLG